MGAYSPQQAAHGANSLTTTYGHAFRAENGYVPLPLRDSDFRSWFAGAFKDHPGVARHSIETSAVISELVGEAGLDKYTAELMALTHDVGKPVVGVYKKEGKLTGKEARLKGYHAEIGPNLIPWAPKIVKDAVSIHHERRSGTDRRAITRNLNERRKSGPGAYVEFLRGCDVFSALKEKRTYKSWMDDSKALEVMSEEGSFHYMDGIRKLRKRQTRPIEIRVKKAA